MKAPRISAVLTQGNQRSVCFGNKGHKSNYTFRLIGIAEKSEDYLKFLSNIFPFTFKRAGMYTPSEHIVPGGGCFNVPEGEFPLFEIKFNAGKPGYHALVYAGNVMKAISEYPDVVDKSQWSDDLLNEMVKHYDPHNPGPFTWEHFPLRGMFDAKLYHGKLPTLSAMWKAVNDHYYPAHRIWGTPGIFGSPSYMEKAMNKEKASV